MYRLSCIFLMTLFLGVFACWTAVAQEKTTAPVKAKVDEKPVKETKKEAPAKDKDEKPAKEEPQESPEEQTLKAVKLPTDGPGLLNFFRKRSLDVIAKRTHCQAHRTTWRQKA